jgi:hypothetical protein
MSSTRNGNRNYKWMKDITATAGNNSDPIYLPGWLRTATVTALPNGGSAMVQHTTDASEDVEADPANANWIDWDEGLVASDTSKLLAGPVTALRIQATGATVTLQVVADRP